MNKFLCLAVMIVLSIALIPLAAIGQEIRAESESELTRPDKDQITGLMIQVKRMPVQEQDSKVNRLWKDPSGSKTPRSDFLFCVGFAYLGNHKAQAYLGSAFENGRGIVRDTYESYVWYSIALDNPATDNDAKQKIREGRERIKQELISVYPAPSDYELEELVEEQKQRIAEYLAEI